MSKSSGNCAGHVYPGAIGDPGDDQDEITSLYVGIPENKETDLTIDEAENSSELQSQGAFLLTKGDYEGAETLYRRALETRERLLGPDHPNTAGSLNDLAELLDEKGDYDGAEPLYRRALEIRERVLGPNDPDTAISLNSLAALLHAKGDYNGAEPLYRRSLEMSEKRVGPNHPDTVAIVENLVGTLVAKADRKGLDALNKQFPDQRGFGLKTENPFKKSFICAGVLCAILVLVYLGAAHQYPGQRNRIWDFISFIIVLSLFSAFGTGVWCRLSWKPWSWVRIALTVVGFTAVSTIEFIIPNFFGSFWLSALVTGGWCWASRKPWSWVRIGLTVVGFTAAFTILYGDKPNNFPHFW